MKTMLLLLSLLVIGQIGEAQTSNVERLRARLDSSQATLKTLQSRLDTSQYTRIPNKDFDQAIDGKIFTRVVFIVGFLSTLLSLAGFAVAKSFIESKVKDESEGNKEEFRNEVTLAYKNEITTFRNEFEEYKQRIIEYDERDRLNAIREKKYIINVRFDKLTTLYQDLEAKSTKNGLIQQDDSLEKDLRELLLDADSIQCDEMTTKIINTLSTYLYNLGQRKKYEELVQLVDEYEKKAPGLVSGDAYTNSVLVQFNRYFNATLPQNRDKFLNSLVVLEEKIPEYGHASALRLEVFMMEYKMTTGEEQDKIKNQILKILNQAISSHRNLLAFETIDRLKLDLGSEAFAPNVNDLYQLFPDQMNKMEEKTRTYLVQQYELTRHEYFKGKLNLLFPDDNSRQLFTPSEEIEEVV